MQFLVYAVRGIVGNRSSGKIDLRDAAVTVKLLSVTDTKLGMTIMHKRRSSPGDSQVHVWVKCIPQIGLEFRARLTQPGFHNALGGV